MQLQAARRCAPGELTAAINVRVGADSGNALLHVARARCSYDPRYINAARRVVASLEALVQAISVRDLDPRDYLMY
jgi:hypothetical protein